ncbi:MAG TPA: adenylate/guanylate cyclase domain-containing protein [Candidatus Sulfotelmatobacter sp.]|jgi:class 3 adenylate cyclase|nr:adenylate/guanylate cyclase domain-containing protein [Candidatus Sulfotelmatobacter sp.]
MPDKFDTPSAQFLERKLSTILSADVAEFSRLMGEDEEQTLRVFRGHKKVFESVVAMHNGRIFNTAGDAILAEFPSAVEAVRCATDIQAALRTRNDQLAPNRQVRFRIGINLGDILIQGQDLMGDGVNVAARLQTAAEPGGVCISGTVHDQIRNKLSMSFQSLGEMSFKNIAQPVRTFSITDAEGSGPLPSRQPALATGGKTRWIAGGVGLAVVLVGGGIWAYTAHRSGGSENASVAVPAAQPQVAAPVAAIPSAEKTETKPSVEAKPVDAVKPPAAEKPVAAGKPKPSDEPVRTASVAPQKPMAMAAPVPSTVKIGSLNGIYSGQVCFAETKKDPARCFHGEGTAAGSKLTGRWPMGKDTGVFMNLTGHVAPSGELEIEMHSKAADGTVLNNIFLTGTIQDGLMTAKGAFQMGRKVTLDWHKN